MDYALAKRLKEAGFPQVGLEGHFEDDDNQETSEAVVYLPTLSELIEACGEGFAGLDRDQDSETDEVYWVGKSWNLDKNTHGSTPEIAVANLWLKLHEKNTA